MYHEPIPGSTPPSQEFQNDVDLYENAWTEFLNRQSAVLSPEQFQALNQTSELAVLFLLSVTDNGGEYFAKAVQANLTAARSEVAVNLEKGNSVEATRLAKLTKALGQREHDMYTHTDNGQGATFASRKISSPVTQL